MNNKGDFYLNYSPLHKKYNGKVPYTLLLRTHHWKKKRDEIIDRDKHECQKCGAKESQLKTVDGNTYHVEISIVDIIQENGDITPRQSVKHIPSPVLLNVHHRKYRKGVQPWNYPNEDLTTLCVSCHQAEHGINSDGKLPDYVKDICVCDKCNGTGIVKIYRYNWQGLCFKCAGTGSVIEYKDIN